MADVYQEQARYFANVQIMQSGVVASVHLEDDNDKKFWNAILQDQHPGRYYFITHSRNPKGLDAKGCNQCLNYRPYLSKKFFICIDSDMRYLLQEPNLDAAHFVCQTYTYSWENHYCEAKELQKRFTEKCPEKACLFNFETFLSAYSSAVFKPLLLLLYCLRSCKTDFTKRMFIACLPHQCKGEELADNGHLLIERITDNFKPYLNTALAKSIDFEAESAYCQSLNVNEQNVYLHVRGHNLFDLIAYIGDLLCHDTSVSFKNDVLTSSLPPQNHWQIKKVATDLSVIL